MPRCARFFLAFVVLSAFTSCGSGSGDGGRVTGDDVVLVRSFKFSPKAITVRSGKEVVWDFADGSIPHDVKFKGFKSRVLRKAQYRHTFDKPGSFDYICSIHPFMKGTVKVT